MATFGFETTTIINSLTAPGFAGVTANAGSDQISAHPRFWVDTKNADNPILRIAKGGVFAKNNIKCVYKRNWEAPEYFKVTFDMTKATAKLTDTVTSLLGRLVIKIELQGSNDVLYADAYSRHIKPVYIEFPVVTADKSKETDLAKKVAKIANKYGNLIYGDLQLKCSASGTSVVVEGVDEYQRVAEASLEIYNENAQSFDCCCSFGDYEKDSDGVIVNQGKPGFGTYRQLVKDIILPTDAHRAWASPFEDEAPVLGAHYNEYTITLEAEREGLGGLSAVGQKVVSTTTHTFWVKTDVVAAFETALNAVTTKDNAITADKDYDDQTVDKATLEDSYQDPTKIAAVQKTAQGANTADATTIANARGLSNGKRVPKAAADPVP